VHDSPLRTISEAEALSTLSTMELAQPRKIVRVDTRRFGDEIQGGHWQSSHQYLREISASARATADEMGATVVKHVAIAEVPHVIALGAYLGDERQIEGIDFDRDRQRWEWLATDRSIDVQTAGMPTELVAAAGEAVVRVEISYSVLDSEIDQVVARDRLAEIRISPAGRPPIPAIIQSAGDAQVVRLAVRDALAALAKYRPNVEVIHLFVAAPMSVSLAVGQELRLRNGKNVQTYRYRKTSDGKSLVPAILLTNGEVTETGRPLSDADRELATHLRSIWSAALAEVREHAKVLKGDAASSRWYQVLIPTGVVNDVAPFPELQPIWELISDEDRISSTPVSDFGYVKEKREWELNDELILAMYQAAGRDEVELLTYARLFLWHEYLHFWQGITRDAAAGVGQLSNCLERADYLADAYALFHQLDFMTRRSSAEKLTDAHLREILIQQTDVALRSFWTFEQPGALLELQERRLRRYLNWYWRRAQFVGAPDLASSLRLLARQPCIEISGLKKKMGGGNRINLDLDGSKGVGHLQLGIMLEDQRLSRAGSTAYASIEALMRAFSNHQHDEIAKFFSATFDQLKNGGGVFVRDNS